MEDAFRAKAPIIKIVVVGESGVGKSSLIQRFVHNKFSTEFRATIGSDFLAKKVYRSRRGDGPSAYSATETEESSPVTLQVWDTAGQERFRSLGTSYFRGADAAVIVYDISRGSTFNQVPAWAEDCLRNCGLDPSTSSNLANANLPFFVVGNKLDFPANRREVDRRRADEFCRGLGVTHLETSSKSGENVERLFYTVASGVMARRDRDERVKADARVHQLMGSVNLVKGRGDDSGRRERGAIDTTQSPRRGCRC